MKKHLLAALIVLSMGQWARGEVRGFSIKQSDAAVTVTTAEGKPVLVYRLRQPPDSKLTVRSACYFDDVTTPGGIVMTQVAPPDHPHHRGIFLGWVEMHGAKDADFWGWGEPAPAKGRVIVNRGVEHVSSSDHDASFVATNQWLADDVAMMDERLEASVHPAKDAYVLDLLYTLTPEQDVRLAPWAFGGFCVRVPKDGALTATGPKGLVALPDPSHLKPDTDWPAAAWYDFTIKLDDGKEAGVAVIDHPHNPPSLWHNNRGLRMLNPCITAPGAMLLGAKLPLVLRYRVVVHDGPADARALKTLAKDWASQEKPQ